MAIRSYNAFLKSIRAETGISIKEARVAYRSMSDRLGRPAIGADVSRHPRITKQEAAKAGPSIIKEQRAKERATARVIEKVRRETERPKSNTSLDQYQRWFEEADDYYYEEADGTVDYNGE